MLLAISVNRAGNGLVMVLGFSAAEENPIHDRREPGHIRAMSTNNMQESRPVLAVYIDTLQGIKSDRGDPVIKIDVGRDLRELDGQNLAQILRVCVRHGKRFAESYEFLFVWLEVGVGLCASSANISRRARL
jgi:hypothetical protein